MAQPYLDGSRLGITQTEHINQSLLGVLARLFSAAVAIPAHPPGVPDDVSITLLALPQATLHLLHRAVCALIILAALLAARAPRSSAASHHASGVVQSEQRASLGEWSVFVLAMLLVSERSWKQHYVVLFLPLACLAWHAFPGPRISSPAPDWMVLRARRIAWVGLASSALLHGLSGSAVLGSVGSDFAEAYGVHLWGALILFVCCAQTISFPRTAATQTGL